MKRVNRTWLAATALVGFLARSAVAGPEELVGMERAFAAAVSVRGVNAAFLEFLAEDGLLLRPRPVRGPEFFRQAPPDPGLLEWAPAYARIAESGDLGFTTGPWTYRTPRTNNVVSAAGQYLTVWRRTPAGWRAALDAGIGSPAQSFPWHVDTDGPDDPDEPLPGWRQDQRNRDLRFVDDSFARRAAREGEAVALDAYGHKRVRLLRSGALPVLGRHDAVQTLSANRRKTRDARQGLLLSSGGDLGCAWGESELLGSATTPPQPVRSWVRIWRRSGWSGTWRVALDLAVDYSGPAEAPTNPAAPAP